MIHFIILLIIIGGDMALLLFQASTLSISTHEASILYGSYSFIKLVEQLSLILFGQNDLALRSPMILVHFLSILLLYSISTKYLKDMKNRIWLILVFILLPGVLSSALLVDAAGVIIFGLLLFIFVYEKYSQKSTYILLMLYSVIDFGFVYLFISLIFYSIYKRDKEFFVINLFLSFVTTVIHKTYINGTPQGHFIDTIGIYAAVFTPVIFIYIFYILYKRFLSKDINILWFISVIPMVISLLLSLRQNIQINDFAPYLIIALPLAAESFYSSYRIRLRMFRKSYKMIFTLSAAFLLVNFIVVIFNRELYLVIEDPQKHFARKMHIAKELAKELNNRDIKCVNTKQNMAIRLKFYGIESCEKYKLIEVNPNVMPTENIVTISYKYRPIYRAVVTKINTK
jgi:hypothetical protein